MIRIQRRGGAPGSPEGAFTYRIAGTDLVSNLPLPLAAGYESGAAAEPLPSWSPPSASSGEVIYDGDGWLEGCRVHARCAVRGDGLEVAVGAAQRFWVAADGGAIAELDAPSPDDAGTALLGPPLVLALALRGTFAFHASAVAAAASPGAIALCGPTGAGKSTLAAAAAESGLHRLADDLLVLPAGDIGTARVDFPQLKFPATERPRHAAAEAVPLRAVLWLGSVPVGAAPSVQRLSGAAALSRLVASTVAARLFPPQLAARHLAFCGALAARVPIGELSYARQREVIPDVFAAIDRWLEAERPFDPL